MNKICCYTCITGGYDSLKMISGQKSETMQQVDFICFTDNDQLKQLDWQTRPIPRELDGLSNVKKQRVIKICPHKWLSGYDISIWVDGSFQICGDLLEFVQKYDLEKTPLYTRVHPARKCIYKEAEACIALKKDSREVIEKQMARYRAEGYPENAGMFETGVVLRRHGNVKCQLVCNRWASELLVGSCRDQLSFNYACWREHFLPGCLNTEFSLLGKRANTFRLCRHEQRR